MHTPRLIFLTVGNEGLITNLMVELLNTSDGGVMSKTGRLWPYSCCLFAIFVMRYFDCRKVSNAHCYQNLQPEVVPPLEGFSFVGLLNIVTLTQELNCCVLLHEHYIKRVR